MIGLALFEQICPRRTKLFRHGIHVPVFERERFFKRAGEQRDVWRVAQTKPRNRDQEDLAKELKG